MQRSEWRQILTTLACVVALALVLNWAILRFFGQRSADRAEHSLIGIIMLMGYVYLFVYKSKGRVGALPFFVMGLVPCYLGTVFPDLDITFLGIGAHRNPLFHSSLSLWLVVWLMGRQRVWLRPLIAGYGVGLASHLWWDVVDYGNVHWLPGGLLDRLWLGANGLAALMPFMIERERRYY